MIDVDVRHRQAAAAIARKTPERAVVDVTSRADEPWVQLSPFFPHHGIPVPFTNGRTAASVEGVWQALKVFESADVDEGTLENATMKGLKRTVRKYGRCLGHRRGLAGAELLGYLDARRLIYLPTYAWVLEHRVTDLVDRLAAIAGERPLTLLDYETNCDVENLAKPLSHAGLVAAAVRARFT